MDQKDVDLRCVFTNASLGQTAYRTWANQARRERFFNVARLLEALCAAKQARAEYALQQLGEVSLTKQNVTRALHSLEPEAITTGPITGSTPLARDMLQRAQRALADNRDLRADELGDLAVCSRCGFLSEGQLTGPCPICGTVPEAHRLFRAIDAMGTLGPHAIVQSLEKSESALRKLLQDLDDATLSERPSREQPSLKELTGHLTDMDAVFRERAWLLLETDKPELPPAHPPKLDAAASYRELPIEEILGKFHESRRQTLSLLRGLTSAAWHRLGHHELYGTIDLLHQGNWVIQHERSHLVEMAQIRHDLLVAHGKTQQADELGEPVVEMAQSGE